jgi:hypothetical protein
MRDFMNAIDIAGSKQVNLQPALDQERPDSIAQEIMKPADEKDAELLQMSDLRPIAPGDANEFLAAAEAGEVDCWFAFFPRLYFYGGIKNHDLLWERYNESILVYQARRKKDEVQLNLYLPPFPFDPAALRHAQERMQAFNKGPGGRIVFVQETEALKVARVGFEITFKEQQYIYDRAAVLALEGSRYSTLRRKLATAARDAIEVRPYEMSDQAACLALTKSWRERLISTGINPTSYRHTVECLKEAHLFPSSLLKGMVAEIGGVLAGYAFAGPITSRTGALYITINDTRAPSVAYLLRHELMKAMPALHQFNDSSDSKRAGLRDLKQRFRPKAMLNIYGARSR